MLTVEKSLFLTKVVKRITSNINTCTVLYCTVGQDLYSKSVANVYAKYCVITEMINLGVSKNTNSTSPSYH